MSGVHRGRGSRGSQTRNVPQPTKRGSNREFFPSGEDYVSSAGRGFGSVRANRKQSSDSQGPFPRGNHDFRSNEERRKPLGNRGSRGSQISMDRYADTTPASRRNVFGNEVGRSNNTAPDFNQFPRTDDDTVHMDDTSQEGQQNGNTGPQQRYSCYRCFSTIQLFLSEYIFHRKNLVENMIVESWDKVAT